MNGYDDFDELIIPKELSILPLRDAVIYPSMVSPLIIARPRSIELIEDVMEGSRIVGLIAQKSGDIEDPQTSDIYRYGVAANVLKMLKFPDGSLRVLIQGLMRFKVLRFSQKEPYFRARIKLLQDIEEETVEVKALASNITNQFQRIIALVPNLPDELQIAVMNMKFPGKLADLLASNLNLSLPEKQEILESLNVKRRLENLTVLISRELEVLEMGTKIQNKVQLELGKNQREFFLREQLRAIHNELGEGDDRLTELNELHDKIAKAKMSTRAEEEAYRELDRLSKMPPGAAEYTVSRTYIDWLISLPWSISTEDNLDIAQAEKILNDDHYNLIKVKERILEYLAVRKLKHDMKGPILCFVGPPGVGKTSLGRSIARSLGRKFIRNSLGGVHDEAEIRGHRRTYIGSLPGRIVQGIKNAGSNNPVFMLDEVDKIGQDFRGDPASALLEVLDPEQNYEFSDHYLDVPFDLSKVLFITTANYTDPIPPALLDRMEILELPGYTEEEKISIAMKYLIPKQRKEHGLTAQLISFQKTALKTIIAEYTHEAGLRNLEREIASVCRKVAKEVAKGNKEKILITPEKINEYLGPPKYFSELAERTDIPGVAIGLAWTPAGGDILFIESSAMPGSKGLSLTGQLGDVMKESAQAALSLVRAKADELKIPRTYFDRHDIHLHVPSGGIPKDGPSAGITMVTSLVSLITKRPVKNNIAMTGEITLRGKVLPIGGVKEKILAARRAGIKEVILPKRNENDLVEVAEIVKKALTFHYVEEIDEVLELALKKRARRKK
ncbi:endopeptidase La [candidate division KSB1 bacterium]|nr:endopeptidase La [candidate division KSB1 bacterium]